jgi:hypothetical protein
MPFLYAVLTKNEGTKRKYRMTLLENMETAVEPEFHTWLTLEGSVWDGGEIVSREIQGKELQESFEGSARDVVQQVVSQIQLEHHG